MSFPFYLTHLWVLLWYSVVFPTDDVPLKLCLVAASLLTTLGLASVLHRWVELPFQRLGRSRPIGPGVPTLTGP